MEPEVIIKCQGAGEVTLDELQPLHHFKTLTEADYARGRNALLERGFKFPFTTWIAPDGVKWVVDGHQRNPILKRMRDEGIKVPERFPTNYVFADSKEDAAVDIIGSETKFADINPGEFTSFLVDYGIDWAKVDSWADIPGLGADSEDKPGISDGGSKKGVICPNCQHHFTPGKENYE